MRPDGLRHLEARRGPSPRRREVGLHVQRGDDAEDDGEDAADEDGEEIVDARSAAAQAVEALQLERRAARAPAMNGSTLMYCRSGGMPLVTGISPVWKRRT